MRKRPQEFLGQPHAPSLGCRWQAPQDQGVLLRKAAAYPLDELMSLEPTSYRLWSYPAHSFFF